tara:strand:- start:14 stop:598 length:585 start_codon:yes stop_codon:yes gene_type:complete
MFSSIDNHKYDSQYTSVNAKNYMDPILAKSQELENGRIRLMDNTNENGTPFFIQEKVTQDDRTNYFNAMKHTFEISRLSSVFFCKENIEIIQNAIRVGVYKRSHNKYIIDKQDPDALKIIMKSVYLQNSKNQNNNITGQIKDLNQIVIDYCVPKIHSELIGYMKYKQDITSLAQPIDHPIKLTQDKTVELNRFF